MNEPMRCPFCGGNAKRSLDDAFEVCDNCAAYGPDEPYGDWNTLHIPTIIDRISRQLKIDLRKWLGPLADLLREQDRPVPWETKEGGE